MVPVSLRDPVRNGNTSFSHLPVTPCTSVRLANGGLLLSKAFMRILILNAGSSSIKYSLYAMGEETLLVSGQVDRGPSTSDAGRRPFEEDPCSAAAKPTAATLTNELAELAQVFSSLKKVGLHDAVQAIGHRVVHGGQKYHSPVRIDTAVLEGIEQAAHWAPLHNPINLAGITTALRLYPHIPQYAIFDTAFFHTLPAHAYRYALPEAWYRQMQIRRVGFHGTSHQYVMKEAAAYLQTSVQRLRLVSLHLGNGASVAAIQQGQCIDTSMGMTPLAGLMMGTRPGDLDPGILLYVADQLKLSPAEMAYQLNYQSGMKGVCGVSDMREVQRKIQQGSNVALLAFEMYCYQIAKYIGAFSISLNGLDVLVFTAGIGENDASTRQKVCDHLSSLGVSLDVRANGTKIKKTTRISAEDSKVCVLVVPAQEELEIARQLYSILSGASEAS